MDLPLSFLPLALIALALLTFGITAICAHLADARPDSQRSRELQFLAEQSLELARQRAGEGTPPPGDALHPMERAA